MKEQPRGLRIIVIEDHDDLREVVAASLTDMGHEVRDIPCAEDLGDELASFRADLLVIDLNLPGEDGLSVARRMRAAQPDIGIIITTARNQTRDIANGYGSGADIYITKPFAPEELGAAVTALSRRLGLSRPDTGLLTLDHRLLQLQGPAGAVNLSNHECQLLAALTKARDQRLETWQLLELGGRSVDEAEKRALAVQMVRLRKKLLDAGAGEPTIKGIRGTGYQLCVGIVLAS